MPRTRPPYPPEFRRQILGRVRPGRTPAELAEEIEPAETAIRNWVRQADREEGRKDDGAPTDEQEELKRLRRENQQLHLEAEILQERLQPGSLGRPTACRRSLRVPGGVPGRISDRH